MVAAVVLLELVAEVAAAPLATSGGVELSDSWC